MTRRVILMGSRATISCLGLRVLKSIGCEIPLIISGSEDPGIDDWRESLAGAARREGYKDGINLFVVPNPHTPPLLERVREAEADIIVSLQWRRIIRPSLIRLVRNTVVNLHNAPLPLLRGCDPFSWAIHDGLETMGVTLHQIVDTGVDSGPIFAQRLWRISPTSTAWSLYEEAVHEGELLLKESLAAIIDGQIAAREQEPRYATYHPLGQFRFDELEVDWHAPAAVVSAALRSRTFPPFQLPFFYLIGRKAEILACEAVEGRGEAGTVLSTEPLVIATRPGAIEIHRVRFEGCELSGSEFARIRNQFIGSAV